VTVGESQAATVSDPRAAIDSSAQDPLVAQIGALLREVTGEGEQWLAALGPHTCLDADLLLESVELAELGDALARRYGEQVDLVGHVATLELDQIIALTIADVAAYVASRTTGGRR
jgi:hypothetical protein